MVCFIWAILVGILNTHLKTGCHTWSSYPYLSSTFCRNSLYKIRWQGWNPFYKPRSRGWNIHPKSLLLSILSILYNREAFCGERSENQGEKTAFFEFKTGLRNIVQEWRGASLSASNPSTNLTLHVPLSPMNCQVYPWIPPPPALLVSAQFSKNLSPEEAHGLPEHCFIDKKKKKLRIYFQIINATCFCK